MLHKFVFLIILAAANGLSNEKVLAPKLKLNDGREIPALALGTWLGNNTKVKEVKINKKFFQHGRVEPSANEVELAVGWAVDAGYRHIDTAYAYKVEDQVGRALAKKLQEVPRDELFITTKLWNDRHARDAVVPALQESLQKLGLDYIDLYLIHWPIGQFANLSSDNTDYLETWRGMMDAKQKGLAKSIGLSNFNEQMIDRILDNGLELPAVLQVEVNLNLQQPELLKYCKDKNIVVMGYTPFGSLFYSKAKPNSPPPRIDDPTLVNIAKKYKKTVPQIALRYLIELGVIPIPKSLTKSRIEQNIGVFDFQLTDEEKNVLKSYDRDYRTIPQLKWLDHPFYPFKKNN